MSALIQQTKKKRRKTRDRTVFRRFEREGRVVASVNEISLERSRWQGGAAAESEILWEAQEVNDSSEVVFPRLVAS